MQQVEEQAKGPKYALDEGAAASIPRKNFPAHLPPASQACHGGHALGGAAITEKVNVEVCTRL
jgi:hypothetical protein